ncbi:cell cycle control protein 50A-like [Ornithodoros turicata]|uniref:cell cycle control protein 50A-like n=1 Tax=Ornithodoros turicata TaxID=34597 RepID=UPI00313A0E04
MTIDVAKVNRPQRSGFKQQRLKAWSPLLTAGTMIKFFVGTGIAATVIGVVLLVGNKELQEYQFDYTNCKAVNTNRTCASILQINPRLSCICLEPFQLPQDIVAPVHMYYSLTDYYQNFRTYVQSRDDAQLLGKPCHVRYHCAPYRREPHTRKCYYPCGSIANSIFNDTLRLKYKTDKPHTIRDVPLNFKEISWPTDRELKFRIAPGNASSRTVKPPDWPKPVDEIPDGIQNEALIVWMRTAALPTFRKLYAFIDHESKIDFNKVLPMGKYFLNIRYQYPVWQFGGRKRLILSNANWMGSRNPFMGMAYVCVGALCLTFSVICVAIHRRFGSRKYQMPPLSAHWLKENTRPPVPPLPSLQPPTTPVPLIPAPAPPTPRASAAPQLLQRTRPPYLAQRAPAPVLHLRAPSTAPSVPASPAPLPTVPRLAPAYAARTPAPLHVPPPGT